MNVYVIATEIKPLLSDEAGVQELLLGYRTNRLRWDTIHGVLPYQHSITGAFGYRGAVTGEEIEQAPDWSGASLVSAHRDANRLTLERQRLQAMKRSDIGFLWLGGSATAEMISDAMCLYGMGKEVVVACASIFELLQQPMMVEAMRDKAVVCSVGMKKAYEIAMADMDVKVQQKFVLMTSKYSGLCRGCGGPYGPGEPIMWSRAHGVLHKDCYDANQDPDKASPALFSAELVGSLRLKLNELERENTMLMARVSAMERGE